MEVALGIEHYDHAELLGEAEKAGVYLHDMAESAMREFRGDSSPAARMHIEMLHRSARAVYDLRHAFVAMRTRAKTVVRRHHDSVERNARATKRRRHGERHTQEDALEMEDQIAL